MAFKSTYNYKKSSSQRSTSSYTGYNNSNNDRQENESGCCRECAYFTRYTKGSGAFSYPYCTYHGKDLEGMLAEYGSCSLFKRR